MKKIFVMAMGILAIYSVVKGMSDASASLSADISDESLSLSGEPEFPVVPIDWSSQLPLGDIGRSLGMEEEVEPRPIKVKPDLKEIIAEDVFPEDILEPGNYIDYRKFISLIADIYTNPQPVFHEEFLNRWRSMVKLSRVGDESDVAVIYAVPTKIPEGEELKGILENAVSDEDLQERMLDMLSAE